MPPETLLAFDTSAAHCAAALLLPGRIEVRVEPMAKGQAERLVPLLEELLTSQGLAWGDLHAIGVGLGPGNFTGIRISVALARGLALGLSVPAIGVTGFEVISEGRGTPHWALIDAPRGRFYAQRSGDAPGLIDTDQGLDVPSHRLSDLTGEAMVERLAQVARRKAAAPQPRPAPFYLRAPDADPPSDPPPRILDPC